MKEGHRFVAAIGVFDHFTVAGGIPSGVETTKSRIVAKLAIEALIQKLRDDFDLLEYDYSYSDPDHPSSKLGGGQSGYRAFGYLAAIDARPSGFCQLKLSEVAPSGRGRTVGLMDVRNRETIPLDSGGEIRVRRRKIGLDCLPKLEALRSFLNDGQFKDVVITVHSK